MTADDTDDRDRRKDSECEPPNNRERGVWAPFGTIHVETYPEEDVEVLVSGWDVDDPNRPDVSTEISAGPGSASASMTADLARELAGELQDAADHVEDPTSLGDG